MTTHRTQIHVPAARRRRPSSLGATVARTTAANVAVPLSALLTGPLLARYLGPADRGTLAAVLTPLALVTLLGAVGLPEAVTYAVASRLAPLRQVLRAGLAIGLVSGVVSAAVIWPLAPVLLRNSPDQVGLMRWMTVLVVASMAMAAVRAAAQGRGRFDLSNAERWLSVITRLPLLVLLAVTGALTVTSAAWATYATGVVAMLVLWLVLRERDDPPVAPVARLERKLLSFGAQAWIGTVASILVLRLDQAVLAPLVGAAQLGFYAVAVSLAEVPSTLQLAMRDVMFATATDRRDPHLIARSNRILMLLSAGLAAVGAIACPLVLPLLFGDAFDPATADGPDPLPRLHPGGDRHDRGRRAAQRRPAAGALGRAGRRPGRQRRTAAGARRAARRDGGGVGRGRLGDVHRGRLGRAVHAGHRGDAGRVPAPAPRGRRDGRRAGAAVRRAGPFGELPIEGGLT